MSPKNKGKFGKGKSAVEIEDEFISTAGRVSQALKPYVKQIVFGVSAVLALLAVFFTYRWWDARKETKATTLYQKAVTLAGVMVLPDPPKDEGAEATEGSAEGAEAGQAAPQPVATIKDEDRDGVPDSFPSKAERAKAVLAELDRLRSEYGSTDAAKETTLLHASMLYDAGRYADAVTMYQAYLNSGATPELKALAREGMGYAQEAMALAMEPQARQAEFEKVLGTFRKIQTSDQGPGRDRALYHEARILVALGKKDEAIAALKKALEIAPEGSLSYDINERLAHLEAAK